MRHSKLSREGYLMIDHRASPGLPADFFHKIGLAAVALPAVGEGAMYECPTMTCVHCNAVVILNPLRTRPRGYCRRCDDYVCDSPVCSAECRPFEQIIDEVQEGKSLNLPLLTKG